MHKLEDNVSARLEILKEQENPPPLTWISYEWHLEDLNPLHPISKTFSCHRATASIERFRKVQVGCSLYIIKSWPFGISESR